VPQVIGGPDPKVSGTPILEAGEALDLLYRAHLGSDKLTPICHMGRHPQFLQNPLMERFLHAVLRSNTHPSVQAQACLSLARIALDRAAIVEEIKRKGKDSDYARRLEPFYGSDEIRRLSSSDPVDLRREAEGYLNRLAKEYGSLPVYGEKVSFSEKASSLRADLSELVVGRPALEIDGADVNGVKMKLTEFRGKVVMLVFWGTWCAPCMAMVLQERDLLARHKGRPFVLVGVNSDDDVAKVREAIRKHEITWRSWKDGQGGPIATRWGVSAWPAVYLLDSAGTIRYKNVHGRELDEAIEALLKKAEGI
jgi:peroxiredoxin